VKDGSVTRPANRHAIGRHNQASFTRRPGKNMPVAGEVGRGVDHPLREHDLAGEPPARVGAAELGGGRGDVGDGVPVLLLLILLLLSVAVGGRRRGGGGEEGTGEGASARLGVGAPGGLRL